MKALIPVALVFMGIFFIASSATLVPVASQRLQTKAGLLTYVYFETVSGPSSPTPSPNTAQTPPSGSSSYTINQGVTGYLWSPQFTSSTTISAGKWVVDLWGQIGTLTYIPITITNSQTSSTPNPFQQRITWNPSTYSSYEATNLGNIRFYSDSSCTTPLYAWLESCTPTLSNTATSATAWVKLTSPIAGSGGTLTIYMAFLPTSTTYDGNYWGEAPQLSGTYGQYDNGALVFNQYGGASWSGFTTYEGAWDTANGYLEQTSSSPLGFSGGGPAALIKSTSYPSNGQYVIETAFSYSSQAVARVGIVAVAGLSGSDPVGYRFIGQQSNNGAGFISFLNDLVVWVVSGAYSGSVTTAYTMQVVDNGGTWSGALFSGYGIGGSTLATLAPTAYTAANKVGGTNGYVGICAARYDGTNVDGNPASFQWFRLRAYPPSNVMPTVSFGSLTTVNTVSISILITDSSGNIQTTMAGNVQTPIIGLTKTQIIVRVDGAQVTIPQNGYVLVTILSSSARITMYWGTGQFTNFQVPYRILS